MLQLEHIDAIERRLWSAADTLRANSKYASNEYFLPVMGLVFLRHAYSRYLAVKDEIEAGLPTRGSRKRAVTREDFAQKNALFLRPEAQFDHLVALPDGKDRVAAIIAAMESIEADYASLRGVLPRSEYQALDNEVLGDLLRKLNRKLVETGAVDVMIAIRSNFFYTRTVPCELWFLNRAKPDAHRDKVLMIDARNIYRKVTRKIYDFSPEQQQNLLAVVWLYRGETARFREIAFQHLWRVAEEGGWCFEWESDDGETGRPLQEFAAAIAVLSGELSPFLKTLPKTGAPAAHLAELGREQKRFQREVKRFRVRIDKAAPQWEGTPDTNAGLNNLVDRFAPLAESSRDLTVQADQIYKAAARLIETCEQQCGAKSSDAWNGRAVTRARKAADEARREAVEQLRKVRYFWRQAHWLTERFPDGELRDVEGLVKLVDRSEIEANDWSLTPGRYVGVAPEEEDEDFDFATAMREIHAELADLNAEAAVLAARIQENFEKLGI